jgi:hypothetical protein
MLEEHFIKADPVTDDYITGAEDGPGEMAAVRARKDLNQVFFAFVITLHFLDKLNLFHATAKLLNQIRGRYISQDNSKHRANEKTRHLSQGSITPKENSR